MKHRVPFLKKLKSFWDPVGASKKVYEDIKDQRVRIKKLMEELKVSNSWAEQYSSTLSSVTETIEAMVWEKDVNHLYVLANRLHCYNFFNFEGSTECLQYIKGKSDLFLIDTIFRQNGIQNTFGEICMLSDKHTQEKGVVTHFLEAGKVDHTDVLLYIIKIPKYNKDNEFIGTVGLGWNFSKFSCLLIPTLNRWIYDNDVEVLYCSDNVFCYALAEVKEKFCGIFNHICPDPVREHRKCPDCYHEKSHVKGECNDRLD